MTESPTGGTGSGRIEVSRNDREHERSSWENRARTAVKAGLRGIGVATAPLRPLPDYLIIGGKRCGSTTLHYTLLQHPQVLPMFPSKRLLPMAEDLKGVHHFDVQGERSEAWYRSHFPTVVTRRLVGRGRPVVVGETSPYYLHEPGAPARAAARVPEVRLLCVLRDPVERAASHFREQRRRGLEPLETLAEAIAAEPSRLADPDPAVRAFAHEHRSYATQGEYATDLERWSEHFGSDRIQVIFSEHLFADPAGTLARITDFLGLERHDFRLDRMNATAPTAVDPAIAAALRDRYVEPDRRLADLLGTEVPWR